MTRVDFYVLEGGARRRLACRLAEKAQGLGHQVFIHTTSSDEARALDDLLWTFRAGSFVPHALCGPDGDQDVPVRIGHDTEPHDRCDVLINLDDEVPAFFSRFERVAEIVDEESREPARERYRFYQSRNYPLHTHRISS